MKQTILFTVIPRGITLEQNARRDTLPVSVVVSPRLTGGVTLNSFKDWLHWTQLLQDHGLELTFSCDGQTHTQAIDPTPLRPDLWEAIFNAKTLVRPFA